VIELFITGGSGKGEKNWDAGKCRPNNSMRRDSKQDTLGQKLRSETAGGRANQLVALIEAKVTRSKDQLKTRTRAQSKRRRGENPKQENSNTRKKNNDNHSNKTNSKNTKRKKKDSNEHQEAPV
jgi:hypothetical protein